jgi:hypothetical protein
MSQKTTETPRQQSLTLNQSNDDKRNNVSHRSEATVPPQNINNPNNRDLNQDRENTSSKTQSRRRKSHTMANTITDHAEHQRVQQQQQTQTKKKKQEPVVELDDPQLPNLSRHTPPPPPQQQQQKKKNYPSLFPQ